MVRVSTSILTQEKEDAVKTFYDLEVAHTDMFHIDVMDGKFVEKNTIELMKDYATTLSHITNLGLDVHFMVENIEEFIDEYIDLNPEYISFHIETSKTKERTMEIINTIKENDIKVAIAINPDTSIEDIKEYIPYVHMVLVMTVVPGKGGQKLIPETLDKVSELKKFIEQENYDIDIEVDGGINAETVEQAKQAGANVLVAGSYVLNSSNLKEAISNLKK
ncbi:MAG: ribulose-phosphate 3-epimerase [Clostridia bacterium]|nr:ribulose-phosphate 3-epimerase [Clostridia bacterium]